MSKSSSNTFVSIGLILAFIITLALAFAMPTEAQEDNSFTIDIPEGVYHGTGSNHNLGSFDVPEEYIGGKADVCFNNNGSVHPKGETRPTNAAETNNITVSSNGSTAFLQDVERTPDAETCQSLPVLGTSVTVSLYIGSKTGTSSLGGGVIVLEVTEVPEECKVNPDLLKCQPKEAPEPKVYLPNVSCPEITGLDQVGFDRLPDGEYPVDGHVLRLWSHLGQRQGSYGPFGHGDGPQEGETRRFEVMPGVFFSVNWTVVGAGSIQYSCFVQVVSATPTPTLYSDCEEKILVQRVNQETVEDWDVSDIISIKNFTASVDKWQFANVTQEWAESLENQPALSWDGCWFVAERLIEGQNSLWWSAFGEPHQIKVNGQSVNGKEPNTGPKGEIVYRDSGTNEITLTDRAGSFKRPLGVYGFEPEINQTGERVVYRTSDRQLMWVSIKGVSSGSGLLDIHGILPEYHPERDILFVRENPFLPVNTLAIQGNMSQVIQETALMTVVAGSELAFSISEGDLYYSPDWEEIEAKLVSDPFVDNENAIWVFPDATRSLVSSAPALVEAEIQPEILVEETETKYTVVSGDTLSGICAQFGASIIYGENGCVEKLTESNSLSSSAISPDDIIVIPELE